MMDPTEERGVELKGQQLRARQKAPVHFDPNTYWTEGEKGAKIQKLHAELKNQPGKKPIQTIRENLSEFRSERSAMKAAQKSLKLTKSELIEAKSLIHAYFAEKKLEAQAGKILRKQKPGEYSEKTKAKLGNLQQKHDKLNVPKMPKIKIEKSKAE